MRVPRTVIRAFFLGFAVPLVVALILLTSCLISLRGRLGRHTVPAQPLGPSEGDLGSRHTRTAQQAVV
jgi:hypothetical protein